MGLFFHLPTSKMEDGGRVLPCLVVPLEMEVEGGVRPIREVSIWKFRGSTRVDFYFEEVNFPLTRGNLRMPRTGDSSYVGSYCVKRAYQD